MQYALCKPWHFQWEQLSEFSQETKILCNGQRNISASHPLTQTFLKYRCPLRSEVSGIMIQNVYLHPIPGPHEYVSLHGKEELEDGIDLVTIQPYEDLELFK